MNTLAPPAPIAELDDERRAAAQRLDDDLRRVVSAAWVTTPEVRETLGVLRRRCVAVYRSALAAAAGVPYDQRWTALALTVAAFVSYVSDGTALDPSGQAAERRLRALAAEACP